MKKFAVILSLISFVCFIGLSSSYAQSQKPVKQTQTEQKVSASAATSATPAPTAVEKTEKAGCNHAKDAKCAQPCVKKEAGCCSSKKDAKGCVKTEKELK